MKKKLHIICKNVKNIEKKEKKKSFSFNLLNITLIFILLILIISSLSSKPALAESSYIEKEILQSAAYKFSQSESTVQSDKAVIAEMFTATWCLPCAKADDAFDKLADEYFRSEFIILQYHPYPDNEDPFGTPKINNRMSNYYGADSFPTTIFNGIIDESGGYDGIYDEYKKHIISELKKDSEIEIKINGNLEDNVGKIYTKINSNKDLSNSNLSVRFMVYEDHIYFEGSNGVTDHRFVVRDVLEVEKISLNNNFTEIERTFNLSENWNIDNLGVVVFIQKDGEKIIENIENPILEPQKSDGYEFKAFHLILIISIFSIIFLVFIGIRIQQSNMLMEWKKDRLNNTKSAKQVTHDDFLKCPNCGISIRKSRLESHIKKIHK